MKAFEIVKRFEAELCAYTGAKYAVTVNSCTNALLLAVSYRFRFGQPYYLKSFMQPGVLYEHTWEPLIMAERDKGHKRVQIPKRTYVGVPMSIKHAGGYPEFREENWSGAYRLKPYEIWDCARRFTCGMYEAGQFQCVSFHASKILGDTQGGAILHDNEEADAWFRIMRFDGRTEGVAPRDDPFPHIGWHCYLSPDVAARLLWKLSVLPPHNADLENSDYPDLSTLKIFK